eukprot:GHVU01121548.1.p2 GENE.GHVU01121548.1~~GHVU01121548.1.p2  ORF type:complete len:142 (+),score=9.95 GHVU01121548.1:1689-2114(+)
MEYYGNRSAYQSQAGNGRLPPANYGGYPPYVYPTTTQEMIGAPPPMSQPYPTYARSVPFPSQTEVNYTPQEAGARGPFDWDLLSGEWKKFKRDEISAESLESLRRQASFSTISSLLNHASKRFQWPNGGSREGYLAQIAKK